MTNNPDILHLEKTTHGAMLKLDRKKTAVVATVSPVEVHGPHLPLGQDALEAVVLAERTAEKAIEMNPGWKVIIVPPLYMSCECVPKLGSIRYPTQLVLDAAYYTLEPFARQGFNRLFYSSFHGGPRHIVLLEAAADKLTRKYDVAAASLFSMVASKFKDGNIFFEAIRDMKDTGMSLARMNKDWHGGFVETSMALRYWPELVDDGWQSLPHLADVPLGIAEEEGGQSFITGDAGRTDILSEIKKVQAVINDLAETVNHFNKHTYMSFPSLASAEAGEKMFESLTDTCAEVVSKMMKNGATEIVHSPLWKFRDVILSPAFNFIIDDVIKLYRE